MITHYYLDLMAAHHLRRHFGKHFSTKPAIIANNHFLHRTLFHKNGCGFRSQVASHEDCSEFRAKADRQHEAARVRRAR